LNILYKEKLLEIVKSGKLKKNNKNIKLIYNLENEIAILFDKNTLELKGWEIKDQYNNNINFSLKIVSKNNIYQKETFQLPRIN